MYLHSNALHLSGSFTTGTMHSGVVETLHEVVRLRVLFGFELMAA
jgi:hypothetical protein